jgi:histidinol-phosphate/aromatic aminotransferase/cobyric acid decarboxylase-like protein
MAAAITRHTRVVLICTPNNPTGPATGHDELAGFLDRVPGDVLAVIDEAYHEFVTDPSAADALALYRARPNVALMRTFSKAHGLAGRGRAARRGPFPWPAPGPARQGTGQCVSRARAATPMRDC